MKSIRFIYVYREKATGRAVYVGSAFNPRQRDHEHCKGKASVFDRVLHKVGRENFTLEIVEAFRTASRTEMAKLSVARETHWIKLLRTSYKYGGQNIVTPNVGLLGASQEKYEAACQNISQANLGRKLTEEQCKRLRGRKIKLTPAQAADNSKRAKRLMATPEIRSRAREGIISWWAERKKAGYVARRPRRPAAKTRKEYWSPEAKAARSAKMKEFMNSPEMKAKLSASMKQSHSRPETKALIGAITKARRRRRKDEQFLADALIAHVNPQAGPAERPKRQSNNPKVRSAQRSARIKEVLSRPEVKAHHSEALKTAWKKRSEDPEARARYLTAVSVGLKARWARIKAERFLCDAIIAEVNL